MARRLFNNAVVSGGITFHRIYDNYTGTGLCWS